MRGCKNSVYKVFVRDNVKLSRNKFPTVIRELAESPLFPVRFLTVPGNTQGSPDYPRPLQRAEAVDSPSSRVTNRSRARSNRFRTLEIAPRTGRPTYCSTHRLRRIGQQRAELRGRGDDGHGDRLEHDEIPARYRLALKHNRNINAGARGNWLNHRADGAAGAAKFAGSEVFGKTITALSRPTRTTGSRCRNCPHGNADPCPRARRPSRCRTSCRACA